MAHFQKDGLWIQGGQGSPANVDEATPFIAGQLGKVYSVKGASGKDPVFYQYVKRYATQAIVTTPTTGQAAYWVDLDDFVVSAESTDSFGGTTNPVVAGVWLGTKPSAGQYGFIAVGGTIDVSVTDSAAAGIQLQLSSTADDNNFMAFPTAVTITSQAVSVSIPSPVQAVLVEAQTVTDTQDTVLAYLKVLRNGW